MAHYLLDTNICIYIRQKRPAAMLARFETLEEGEAVLSVVTYGELLYGANKSAQRQMALDRLTDLISLLPVLPLPSNAAEHYESSGQISPGAVSRSVATTSGLPRMRWRET